MIALPVVDERRCTGCADCVIGCPVDCLSMSEVLPWLHRPADCLSCGLCELICPEQAIEIAEREEESRAGDQLDARPDSV